MEDKEIIKDLFADVLNSFYTMSEKYGISVYDKDYVKLNDSIVHLETHLFYEWEDYVDILRKVRKM